MSAARAADADAVIADVVAGLAQQRDLAGVLERLVRGARDLVDARYAAIGVPDDDGETFRHFIHTGMDPTTVAALGPLPRRHGLLAEILASGQPLLTDDIAAHPRFGWWPDAHPPMRSFIGMPIVAGGDVVGAFYLADKVSAAAFSGGDAAVLERFTAPAAVAIRFAALVERSRELSVAEERARLQAELHDALNQQLFGLALTARSARGALRTDPDAAEAALATVEQLAGAALEELRALVAGFAAPDLETHGLAGAITRHAELMGRARGREIEVVASGHADLEPESEQQALRIVQEALGNALRHAAARTITVTADLDAGIVAVSDDGAGFDPDGGAAAGSRLGLATMRSRAEAIGGELTVASRPGGGTTVTLRWS